MYCVTPPPHKHISQIEEMTIEPRWEQELNVNRMEYDDLLSSLSSAVSPELCQLVMKMENTVSELSKLAAQSPGKSMYVTPANLKKCMKHF